MALIKMPALSPTMTEGKLAKWLVKIGDSVSSGDVIAEIETDKAVMEVEALDDGVVAAITIAEGSEGVAVGAVIAEKWGRLDVLVGNAALLGPMSPVAHISGEEFEKLMAVNVTANARLIQSMEPLLLASNSGRAVFVTSGVADSAKPFWGGYATSKAALNTLVRCWAHEQQETNLKINLLSPGPIRTSMRAKAMPGEDPSHLTTPEELAPLFIKMLSPEWTQTGQIIDFRQI